MVAKVHWSFGGGTPCAFFQQALVRREMTTDAKAVTCVRCVRWLGTRIGQTAIQDQINKHLAKDRVE